MVVSIALLAGVTPWANVWERLWVSDGAGWGVSKEQGLSAGYCLFLCSGVAVDWLLKRQLGENPDQVRYYLSVSSVATNLRDKLEMG